MAKLKSPLLSMGAEGTIGDALTFQKRGQTTIVREKPIPAYRRTLPQVYQRWLYEDYAYLWTQQTTIIKRQCAATGSRFHLTGFQYWMKLMLATLPDIAGMWHLDEKSGAIAYDSSKRGNNGTIYGATPTVGIIDYALSFDGLNDYMTFPAALNLKLVTPFTLEYFLNPDGLQSKDGWWNLETDWATYYYGFAFYLKNTGKFTFRWSDGTYPWLDVFSNGVYTSNAPNHLAVTYDKVNMTFYLNGAIDKVSPQTRALVCRLSSPLRFSSRWAPVKAIIDEPRFYNRVLSAQEIKRHSERRYPP